MKGQSRLDVRKYSFSQRTGNEWNKLSADCVHSSCVNLLLNLRSPRDYVGPPFVRSFALSPLDGASVREAHCDQASTAVRKAHCAQATVARLVTFESLKWRYSFPTNSALFMKLGSLLYMRCRHLSAKSTAVSNKTFLFQQGWKLTEITH